MAFCPNCGKQNADTVAACVSCGQELKAAGGAAGAKFKGTMLMPGGSMGMPPDQLAAQLGQNLPQQSGQAPSATEPGAMPQPGPSPQAAPAPQQPPQPGQQGDVQQPSKQADLAFQATMLGTPDMQPAAPGAAPQAASAPGPAPAQVGAAAAAPPSLKGTVVAGGAPPALGQVPAAAAAQPGAAASPASSNVAAAPQAASAPGPEPVQGGAGSDARPLTTGQTGPAQKTSIWLWAFLACAALLSAIAIASGLLRG